MESKIFFIRHGITVGNLNSWYYGATDLPLAQEGIDKVTRMAEAGCYPRFAEDAGYYTTGLIRTEHTLELVVGPREHRQIPKLQEMRFGEYECKGFEELKDDPVFLEWGYDKTGEVALPGAETLNQFKSRIEEGLDELIGYHRLTELAHRHDGKPAHSVMFCHGGVISAKCHFCFLQRTARPGTGCRIRGRDISYHSKTVTLFPMRRLSTQQRKQKMKMTCPSMGCFLIDLKSLPEAAK